MCDLVKANCYNNVVGSGLDNTNNQCLESSSSRKQHLSTSTGYGGQQQDNCELAQRSSCHGNGWMDNCHLGINKHRLVGAKKSLSAH